MLREKQKPKREQSLELQQQSNSLFSLFSQKFSLKQKSHYTSLLCFILQEYAILSSFFFLSNFFFMPYLKKGEIKYTEKTVEESREVGLEQGEKKEESHLTQRATAITNLILFFPVPILLPHCLLLLLLLLLEKKGSYQPANHLYHKKTFKHERKKETTNNSKKVACTQLLVCCC